MLAIAPVDVGPRKPRLAIQADDALGRAVQLDDLPTAGLLMQAVGVLRDDGAQVATRLEVHERSMGGIRLGVRAPVLEAVSPVLGGIPTECIDVRDFVGIEFGPEPALAPKVGDATLDRDPRPGKRDGRACRPQQGRYPVQGGFGDGGHRSPAKRSCSGMGASTELRTRSKVSMPQTFGPNTSLSFKNQLSSGIWVRCARMAPSFLSMKGVTSSQVVTRSSDTAKGGGSPSVEKRFSTPARFIGSVICRLHDLGKAP